MKPRSIIHVNIADFAARIETSLCPSLKGSPVVIAPQGAPRAVVYDMNEAAFQEGIRKGMPLSHVMHRHRGIPILPPRFNRYELAMKEIRKHGLAYTPAVESGIGDGHLFLDITGTGRLYGPPPDVAFRLKKAIKKVFGLDPIWSLATSKLVAKVASRIVKPLGEYIVAPGEEAEFLDPLPIKILPGLSREEINTITRFNLVTISQVRRLTPAQLSIPFAGRAGHIHKLLQGQDLDPVTPAPGPGLTADHEFPTDTNDTDDLKAALSRLTDRIGLGLDRRKCHARQISMSISYSDGVRHKTSLPCTPTGSPFLFKQTWDLFLKTCKRRVRIRHLALSCLTVPAAPVQADLFQRPDRNVKKTKTSKTAKAVNKIRTRFGATAVMTAAALPKPCETRHLATDFRCAS